VSDSDLLKDFDFGDSPIAAELAKTTTQALKLSDVKIPKPKETRIVACMNQKGGVGKTTTVVNLAAVLAEAGHRVLVVDFDPQGNTSTALDIEHPAGTPSSYNAIIDQQPLTEIIQETKYPNLFISPSTIDLAGAEIELTAVSLRETRLKKALTKLLEAEHFDWIFIDCPPSMGLIVVNALTAATEVLIPIQTEFYALEGLSMLVRVIDSIKEELNPELYISSVILTMYDSRINLSHEVEEEVRKTFPDATLETYIPRNISVAEAPSFNQTVIDYAPRSAGAVAYRAAALELAKKEAM
jgi:chromosome partitioning protein